MIRSQILMAAAVITLALGASTVSGQQNRPDTMPIYGSQLMTVQEQNEYRERIRTAKTEEERNQIRAEHHQEMQARAAAQGVTLSEIEPAAGQGDLDRDRDQLRDKDQDTLQDRDRLSNPGTGRQVAPEGPRQPKPDARQRTGGE